MNFQLMLNMICEFVEDKSSEFNNLLIKEIYELQIIFYLLFLLF
jgi:hypothetical protein